MIAAHKKPMQKNTKQSTDNALQRSKNDDGT